MRTLGRRDLNRALLARQLLLERAPVSVPTALERMAGLQAQYAPSMYIGLWSRVSDLERDDVTRALQRRTAVQGTLLRITIHLVSARDYWPFALAVREARRALWLRSHARLVSDPDELVRGAERVRARLRAGPVRRAELDELLGRPQSTGVGLWHDMVRVPPSGTWERRRADLYAGADDWLGPPPAGLGHDTAVQHLVRRYLGAFGPATVADIADWGGLPAKQVTAALQGLTLRRFQAEDGAEMVDVPGAPLPGPDTPAPVRFLPVWDATLLVHARRKGILPEEYRPRVFNTKTPHSVNTFLVDGAVAGTWRYEKGAVDVEPFTPLDPAAELAVSEEADRLAAFHA